MDGDYVFKVDLSGAAREPHQLEFSVDGERAKLVPVGAGSAIEVRIPIKAGPRLIGVAFVERSEARDEATLRPRMRGRGSQPALLNVTISGPYNAIGSGDTPSRRRIFVCHPKTRADEYPCAKKILSTLARRAYRRPVTDEDLSDLLPFFFSGVDSGFDSGIQRALERLLVSPQFLFRIERQPDGIAPGTVYRISDR